MHLQLRLADLGILHAAMETRAVGESFKRFTWRPGQIALGDRGYCNPPGIAHVVEQGADVLVRVNRESLPMRDAGQVICLMSWRSLRGHAAHERSVVIYSREHREYISGRLIVMRLPPAQAEEARARVRRDLGSKASSLDLEAAQYVTLFTTVPRSRMSTATCLALYQVRWQVELAFKRWKSLCHFDHLPNYRDDTILTWLYAKLLLALVMHRMASGASALFPPDSDDEALVRHAVEDCQWPAIVAALLSLACMTSFSTSQAASNAALPSTPSGQCEKTLTAQPLVRHTISFPAGCRPYPELLTAMWGSLRPYVGNLASWPPQRPAKVGVSVPIADGQMVVDGT